MKLESTVRLPSTTKTGPPKVFKACRAEPRPARPTASSAIRSTMPIVNVKKMYGMMKAAPPLVPAQKGNFQIAPRPIAEPAPARMKPMREPHWVVLFIAIGCRSKECRLRSPGRKD